ncbi:hypothetical protein JF540_27210 [Salipiger thiooxidans]|uniref:hypothetical protein n=1 Tax=Salipiger thiooxidans TaxID=282683 RepID=UPI001A8C8723|nr:hypothetical protein [Salipiger thiooxidans]MBN8190345.1 hypothetical protein [Salipiger thiooxidans]
MKVVQLEIIIAVWGAVLSTVLGSIKIWEVYKSRPQISVSYSVTSGPEHENEIFVENTSATPLMITYWELELRERKFLRRSVKNGRYPDGGYYHVTIGAFGRHTLKFGDEEWFSTSGMKKRQKWYLKLHIAGRRRPVDLLVYPQ